MPNPGISVDPRLYISVPVTINFAGTNANNPPIPPALPYNLLQNGSDAFRAFPISSVCSTLTIRLNNSAASINLSDVITSLLRYNTPHKVKEYDYSTCPCMQDYYQNYGEGGAQGNVSIASQRNPLGWFGDNSWETTRGAFPYKYFINAPTTAAISAVITEPLFLSPFLFGKGSELRNGFIGLQTLDLQFTMSADLTRLWSHDASAGTIFTVPVNGAGMVVQFGQPAILFNYISPKLLEPIPRAISYQYYVVDRFPTDNNSPILPNMSSTFSSNNIQMNTIPRRIYLFARQRNSDQNVNSTDTFLSLNNVTINYNNYSGLLASATPYDLYNISKKNGCNLSWPEWSGSPIVFGAGNAVVNDVGQSVYINNSGVATLATNAVPLVGSVLCLDFGIDIGLDDLHSAGEIQNSQLQITATFTNINPTLAITATFYIVTISEGIWTIENLNMQKIFFVTISLFIFKE